MRDRVIVLYATREGQTKKVACRIGATLQDRGFEIDVENVRSVRGDEPLGGYRTAVLAASLHANGHEREMVAFARRYRNELQWMHATFVSVSLSEAGAEDERRSTEERAHFATDVARTLHAFEAETGWRPSRIEPVAGALAYSKYNLIVRFVMRR